MKEIGLGLLILILGELSQVGEVPIKCTVRTLASPRGFSRMHRKKADSDWNCRKNKLAVERKLPNTNIELKSSLAGPTSKVLKEVQGWGDQYLPNCARPIAYCLLPLQHLRGCHQIGGGQLRGPAPCGITTQASARNQSTVKTAFQTTSKAASILRMRLDFLA